MFINVYQCLSMFINVYQCLSMFIKFMGRDDHDAGGTPIPDAFRKVGLKAVAPYSSRCWLYMETDFPFKTQVITGDHWHSVIDGIPWHDQEIQESQDLPSVAAGSGSSDLADVAGCLRSSDATASQLSEGKTRQRLTNLRSLFPDLRGLENDVFPSLKLGTLQLLEIQQYWAVFDISKMNSRLGIVSTNPPNQIILSRSRWLAF